MPAPAIAAANKLPLGLTLVALPVLAALLALLWP